MLIISHWKTVTQRKIESSGTLTDSKIRKVTTKKYIHEALENTRTVLQDCIDQKVKTTIKTTRYKLDIGPGNWDKWTLNLYKLKTRLKLLWLIVKNQKKQSQNLILEDLILAKTKTTNRKSSKNTSELPGDYYSLARELGLRYGIYLYNKYLTQVKGLILNWTTNSTGISPCTRNKTRLLSKNV